MYQSRSRKLTALVKIFFFRKMPAKKCQCQLLFNGRHFVNLVPKVPSLPPERTLGTSLIFHAIVIHVRFEKKKKKGGGGGGLARLAFSFAVFLCVEIVRVHIS